jgi:hypothetical protein
LLPVVQEVSETPVKFHTGNQNTKNLQNWATTMPKTRKGEKS